MAETTKPIPDVTISENDARIYALPIPQQLATGPKTDISAQIDATYAKALGIIQDVANAACATLVSQMKLAAESESSRAAVVCVGAIQLGAPMAPEKGICFEWSHESQQIHDAAKRFLENADADN